MPRPSSILFVVVILLGGLVFVGNSGLVHAVDITGIDDPYSWSMFGGNPAHSGYSLSIGPVNNSQILFNVTLDLSSNSIVSTPVISGERIYLSLSKGRYYSGVFCYSAETGQLLWIGDPFGNFSTVPAVANGLVFAGSEDGLICCFDAYTGRSMWQNKISNTSYSSLTIADGRVYMTSNDGNAYCLNKTTGQLSWELAFGSNLTSPVVADGKEYLASASGTIYCLLASSGNSVWNYSANSQLQCSPAIVGDKTYFGSGDSVYCLTASSGSLVWSSSTGIQPNCSLAVAYQRVYVCSGNQLYCLDTNTGQRNWNYTTDSSVLSPAVADGKVYTNSMNNTYCLDALTGAIVWDIKPISGGVSIPPIVGDQKIVLISRRGNIVAFRARCYQANFLESGLPQGTSWGITLTRWDNLTLSSNFSQINFPVYAGEYLFSITPVNGYEANYPANQTINLTLNQSDVNIPVNFTPQIPVVSEGSDWTLTLATAATLLATVVAIGLSRGPKEKLKT